jgi:hypothetical protein
MREFVAQVDYGKQRERGQACLTVLATFAKAVREEFLGMPLQLPSIPKFSVPEVMVMGRPLQSPSISQVCIPEVDYHGMALR